LEVNTAGFILTAISALFFIGWGASSLAKRIWPWIKRHPWVISVIIGLSMVICGFWMAGRAFDQEFDYFDQHPDFSPGQPLLLKELSLGMLVSLFTLLAIILVILLIVKFFEYSRKIQEEEHQATIRLAQQQRQAEEERRRQAAVAEEKRRREETIRQKREAAARPASEAADRRFQRFMSQYDLDSDYTWYLGDDSFTTYFEGNWTFRHIRDRDSKEWGCSVIEERDGATEVVHYRPSGDSYGWTDEDGNRFVVNSNLIGPGGDKVWPLYRQYLEAYRDYQDWEDDEEEDEDDDEGEEEY
jgi:uncharacterized membrane protein